MNDEGCKMTEAIDFFETMLENMPGDRTSLEFLVIAYEQSGQTDKRRRCLIELADTLIKERQFDDADSIARQLLDKFSSDKDATRVVERVNAAVAANKESRLSLEAADALAGSLDAEGDGSYNVPDPGIEVHAYSRAALTAEMDLVWTLKDKKVLPKEICEELINALSEFPVSERPQLISAISFLDDQHPEWTETVMAELQKMSDTPAVPLELFQTGEILPAGISTAYMIIRGIVPFATMDKELLISVLNPLDTKLQEAVRARVGTGCHFFMSHPGVTLDKISKSFDTSA